MKKRPEKIEIAEVRINDPDGGETIKLTPEEDGEDVVDDIVADVKPDLASVLPIMRRVAGINEQIKELQAELEVEKAAAAEILAPIHLSTGIRGVAGPFGNLTFYYGKNTKFDKKKLKLYLVKQKVKAELVEAAILHATSTKDNDKLSIQYDPDAIKVGGED